MAQTCKNCGKCTCSGSVLTIASNGQHCCTLCVNQIELKIKEKTKG